MRLPPALVAPLALIPLALLASASHRRALALRTETPSVDAHVLVPSRSAARILSMGETELAADLVWIRTLIYYGDGLVHDTGMPDVEKLTDLMNALDPWFRHPYYWAAYATTFRRKYATQAEYRSSVAILRRAVAHFPNDWEFSWLLGLRLAFDLKPPSPAERKSLREEGAMYVERAMHMPKAPPDLATLAVSLRTRLGQKERALRELREMILITDDDKARAALEKRYAALASEAASLDLAEDARRLDNEWKTTLPYVPRTMYILLGRPPPSGIDLQALARGPEVEFGDAD